MTSSVDVSAILQRYDAALEESLSGTLRERTGPLYDMMQHHLGFSASPEARGKHLRPVLLFLSCEAVGGDWRKALPGGAAVELLHNFSLIHDDIQDESPPRRGQPTLWWRWGVAQSINAGDGMHSLSRLALLGLEESGYPAKTILQCGRLLDETCLALCEGQYLDIHYQGRERISTVEYLDMIDKKTAALFSASLQMGAMLGGADEATAQRFARAGRDLGLMYQVRDDVLDLWGGEKTGKAHATDLRNKKKTFPIAYGLEQGARAQGQRLGTLYRQSSLSDADINEAVRLLEETGTPQYCAQEAERHHQAALAELSAVKGKARPLAELRTLASFLRERDY